MFGGYRKNAYLCSTRTPKPLYNAQIGGRFLYIPLLMSITFPKHYKTPEELVELLSERGLYIHEKESACQYIKNIGYYRLSAYLLSIFETS